MFNVKTSVHNFRRKPELIENKCRNVYMKRDTILRFCFFFEKRLSLTNKSSFFLLWLPVMFLGGFKFIFLLFSDDIRCYCNLAKCVATGYMCRTARSHSGGCFSEVHNSNDKSVARHGCMELLQDEWVQFKIYSLASRRILLNSFL